MLILACLIKATSNGPVFFIKERVGLHEKPFRVFKFRTMKVDAEKETGPVWARENEPAGDADRGVSAQSLFG